jgi:hypothetical protein
MQRDSLFGESIVWSGQPKAVLVPTLYRVAAAVCAIAALAATASAVVVATALKAPVGQLIGFAAWMTTLGLALAYVPRWWRGGLKFEITEGHIIVRRGQFRRTIERRGISFARIYWHPSRQGIGDLELVRAVPTGALRRRLTIVLPGLVAPDRVWAMIRGVELTAAAGDGQRLLAQRLDDGERVLWSAHPPSRWRAWLPTSLRGALSVLLALAMSAAVIALAFRTLHGLRSLVVAGLDPTGVSFIALAFSVGLSMLLLALAAAGLGYAAIVRPARLEQQTRYLITDRRILIQRSGEELHLDRGRIVDAIHAPVEHNLVDVFFVLDGPHAVALAPSGAFGEDQGQGLQPVLRRVDGDAVRMALSLVSAPDDSFPQVPRAA